MSTPRRADMEDSGHCAMGTALLLNPNCDGGSPLEGCQLGPEAWRRALPPWHLELSRRYDPGGQLLSRSSFLVSFRDFGPVPLDAVRCPWGLRAAAHQQLQGRAQPGRAAPAAELLGDTIDPSGFLGAGIALHDRISCVFRNLWGISRCCALQTSTGLSVFRHGTTFSAAWGTLLSRMNTGHCENTTYAR